jgi:hypothetical protein
MAAAGDIYMVFDIKNPKNLKAIGRMENANSIGPSVDSGDIDTIKDEPNLQKLSANIDKVFEVNDSVIVKLVKIANEILYIPGFVVEVVPAVAASEAPTYNIGLAKDRTIIGVEEKNIARNIPLKEPLPASAVPGEEGWFFSDTVLLSLLGPNQEITYAAYAAKASDITTNPNGVRKIKVKSLKMSDASVGENDSYELTDPIDLAEKKKYNPS